MLELSISSRHWTHLTVTQGGFEDAAGPLESSIPRQGPEGVTAMMDVAVCLPV
jgi:hypothetical protein